MRTPRRRPHRVSTERPGGGQETASVRVQVRPRGGGRGCWPWSALEIGRDRLVVRPTLRRARTFDRASFGSVLLERLVPRGPVVVSIEHGGTHETLALAWRSRRTEALLVQHGWPVRWITVRLER